VRLRPLTDMVLAEQRALRPDAALYARLLGRERRIARVHRYVTVALLLALLAGLAVLVRSFQRVRA
jgi:hypothetical protein